MTGARLFVGRERERAEIGVHAYNHSDLPLWDVVFGTFRNPPVWLAQGGFYDGGSKRTWAMLLGRDISTPESNPMSPRPALVDYLRNPQRVPDFPR